MRQKIVGILALSLTGPVLIAANAAAAGAVPPAARATAATTAARVTAAARAAASPPAITSVGALSAAYPGARVPVATTARSTRRRSARVRLTFLLSASRRPSRSAVPVGAGVIPAMSSHHTFQGRAAVWIPVRARLGERYLLACPAATGHPRCAAAPLPILAKPSPRSVTPTTDPTHAASQLVTPAAGGTVTATGADGSTYTLVVPPKAIASDETLTLTPVTTLGGLRAGRLAAGVQVSPDGLALLEPAKLTITPASPVPVPRQTGYFWHGDGQESGLYPPSTDPHTFTLTLEHFSGYAIVDATLAQRRQLAAQPTNVQDRYADLAAAVISARSTGDTAPVAKAVDAYLQTRYDAVVKPALDAAALDDTLALGALQIGIDWMHDVQALNAGFDAERTQVTNAMLAVLDHALQQSAKNCATQVGFVERILYFGHLREVFAANDAASLAAVEAAQKCLQYRLDFHATSTEVAGWTFVSSVQVTGMPLTAAGANPADPLAAADAPPATTTVQYTQLPNTSGSGCSFTFTGATEKAPFSVYKLQLDSTLREVIDGRGRATYEVPPPGVTLEMIPGSYLETGSTVCKDDQGPQPVSNMTFTGGWGLTHQQELDEARGHYVLGGWTVSSDGSAQLSYDRTVDGGRGTSWRQQSTFVLTHVAPGS